MCSIFENTSSVYLWTFPRGMFYFSKTFLKSEAASKLTGFN